MSYDNSGNLNKQQKHPKVFFEQYLTNYHEPQDEASHDLPATLEPELLENSFSMRRRFRHLAHRARNRHL